MPGVGLTVNGSRSWLGHGAWRLQPAELMKLALLLYTADLLARRADRMGDVEATLWPVLIVLGATGGLLMLATRPRHRDRDRRDRRGHALHRRELRSRPSAWQPP